MEKPNVVEVIDVSFRYQGSPVVEKLNFTMRQGDFIGIIGPNGAGKTTLFKLIMGLLEPDAGQIRLFGTERRRFDQFSRISYISQKAASINSGFPATVLETVLTGSCAKNGLFSLTTKAQKEYALHCIETVGLSDVSNRLIERLSGGQFQRVLIARALAGRSELMLLDEPTVGIDNKAVEYICCLLARLNKEDGLSVAMITHDLTSVMAHTDSLFVFDEKGGAERMTSEEFRHMDFSHHHKG